MGNCFLSVFVGLFVGRLRVKGNLKKAFVRIGTPGSTSFAQSLPAGIDVVKLFFLGQGRPIIDVDIGELDRESHAALALGLLGRGVGHGAGLFVWLKQGYRSLMLHEYEIMGLRGEEERPWTRNHTIRREANQ